jgi:hypothetical protein
MFLSVPMTFLQRWAAPTPERPLHGASSAHGAELSGATKGYNQSWSERFPKSKTSPRSWSERTINEIELERSWSDLFFIAPVIAQVYIIIFLSNDERITGKKIFIDYMQSILILLKSIVIYDSSSLFCLYKYFLYYK